MGISTSSYYLPINQAGGNLNPFSFGGNKTSGELQNYIADMRVFPNPNNGTFQLSFNVQEPSDLEIELVSLNGNIVYQTQEYAWSGAYKQTIQLGTVPSGIYIISVRTDSEKLVEKLVVH